MEGDFSAVRNRVQSVPTTKRPLTKADLTLSAGTPGSRERIATVQFDRPRGLVDGAVVDLAIMAYESFTTDGSAGDAETFSLSHDFVDSGATSQSLLLYDDGSIVEPDSVDYAADEFTYTDPNTNSDLGVFYASGEQAQVTVRKTAPNGTHETVLTEDVGLVHMRDNNKEPIRFGFSSFWEGIIPNDWSLDIFVKAPYTAALAYDVDSDGNDEPATNALLDLPTRQATQNIAGLKEAVRLHAAGR